MRRSMTWTRWKSGDSTCCSSGSGPTSRSRSSAIRDRPTTPGSGARPTSRPGSARTRITSPTTSTSATCRTRIPARSANSSCPPMHGGEGCRRVLMTADAVGGVWDYALQVAEGLGTCGVEVTLATMGARPRDDQRAAAREIPGLRLVESDYQLEWADHPWDDVARAGSWLLELEAQVRPDIVHLNGYAHGALAWSAPAVVVAHSCVCSWWTAVRGAEAPEEWAAYRRAVREGLRAATAVVAPSAAMLRALSAHYGAVSGTVVPNGRDATQFRTGPKEPLVLSAGRLWDEAKNVTALASIAHRLPWRVALAGETGSGPEGAPDGSVELLGRLSSA